MKIIGIGRNYIDHIKELNNEKPTEPVIFIKPDTSLLRDNAPFYYPKFSNEIHYEVEVVLKISKEGKHIAEEFAGKYYNEIGLGIDLTARDLQAKAKEKGLPWTLAKGFDHSAVISSFFDKGELPNIDTINFELHKNGEVKQNGNTKDMIFSFKKIISYISKYITLKKGDLIFTGTPKGVGALEIGNHIECFLENKKVISFNVK